MMKLRFSTKFNVLWSDCSNISCRLDILLTVQLGFYGNVTVHSLISLMICRAFVYENIRTFFFAERILKH